MNDIDLSKVEHYLAVISIDSMAGSWAVSKKDALEAINSVVKHAKRDWKIYGKGYVAVYDVTHSERFTTEGHPRDSESRKPLPYLYSVHVDLGPKPKSKGAK